MGFIDFLKGVGRVLGRTLGIIKKIVPEQQLEHAIELAREAATKFVDNEARRAWLIAQLRQKFPIGESIARLLVELAVQHLKADVIDAAAQAADTQIAK